MPVFWRTSPIDPTARETEIALKGGDLSFHITMSWDLTNSEIHSSGTNYRQLAVEARVCGLPLATAYAQDVDPTLSDDAMLRIALGSPAHNALMNAAEYLGRLKAIGPQHFSAFEQVYTRFRDGLPQ